MIFKDMQKFLQACGQTEKIQVMSLDQDLRSFQSFVLCILIIQEHLYKLKLNELFKKLARYMNVCSKCGIINRFKCTVFTATGYSHDLSIKRQL